MPHNPSNSDSHLTTFKSSYLISTERDIPQLRKQFLIKKNIGIIKNKLKQYLNDQDITL